MRIIAILAGLVICIAIDTVSKSYFDSVTWYEYYPIIGEYLGFQLSYNTGIAFSFPLTGLPLQIITLILLVGIGYHYLKEEYRKNEAVLDLSYVLLFSGALSHAYERIYIGHVVDFISLKYFAIFNIADIFISVGAFTLLFFYVIYSRRHR